MVMIDHNDGKIRVKSVIPTHKGLEYEIVTTCGKYTITGADFRRIGEDALREETVLDSDILDDLERSCEKLSCIQKSFKFLEYGDMTEKKLRFKLKGKFSEDAIDDALCALKENGYIDDERLASYLCGEYFVSGRMSPKMIKAKLFQKGFTSETISLLFEEYEFDDGTLYENMQSLCNEKFGDVSEGYNKETKIKALEYLVRKGYSYEDSKSFLGSF